MAYRNDILATNPDYLWPFDGDTIDLVAAAVGNNSGGGFPSTQICEDATQSLLFNDTGDSVGLGANSDIELAADRKAVMGWIRVDSIQQPPKTIYREGANQNSQFNLVMWAGNNLMLDVVTPSTNVQAFADQVVTPNRAYCVFLRVEGTGFGNKVEMYIDGVKQSITEPSNGELGVATLPTRLNFSGLGITSNTQVGGENVLLNSANQILHAMWAFWSAANAQLTDQTIRDLFELGALPGVTITTDTEANMQSQLDAIASTVRPNEPLNIRVEDISGGGTLNLTADNITHDPLASIHVQYVGTGTLNWTNINGSDSSIGSVTNGGTLNFINPAVITVGPLIANSEVRIYEAGTANEVAGIENSGTSFSSSIEVGSVDVVVHALDYEYVRITGIDMSQGDVNVPISQVFDRQYENP